MENSFNGEWRVENGELKQYPILTVDAHSQFSFFNFSFVVFTILTKSLTNSSAFGERLSYSADWIYPLSFNNWSQYNVSLASFREMFILCKKSAVLWACSASRINAPMAVPLRSNCLDSTNSLRSDTNNRNNATTTSAKEYDLTATTFFDIASRLKGFIRNCQYTKSAPNNHILNFQFSTLH